MGGSVGHSVVGSIAWCAACLFGGLVGWLVVLVSRSVAGSWNCSDDRSVSVLGDGGFVGWWVELSVRQSGRWSFVWLDGWLVGGWIGQLAVWWVGRCVGELVGQWVQCFFLFGYLEERWVGRIVGWSVAVWLVR
jgi:hypothetical protein